MSIFSKFKLRTAVNRGRRFPLQSQHISTGDFFQLSPIYSRLLTPDNHIKVDVSAFARLEPLTVPTFGRCKMYLRAFFVPYSSVWRGWSDFISDTLHIDSEGFTIRNSHCPVLSELDILNLIAPSSDSDGQNFGLSYFEDVDNVTPLDNQFDFVVNVVESSSRSFYRCIKLLPLGKQVYKILRSLGYVVPNIVHSIIADGELFNAMPLLSFLRVYCDYYQNSQYVRMSDVSRNLEAIFDFDVNADADSTDSFASRFKLTQVLLFCAFVNYQDDYFTSAWDNPISPSSGVGTTPVFVDNTVVPTDSQAIRSRVGSASGEFTTPVIKSQNNSGGAIVNSVNQLSQYILDTLKSVSDYVKRQQLSGSHAGDRFKARFGLDIPEMDSRRCKYLGSKTIELRVGDVFSTADTDGAGLGEFAGRAYMAPDGQNTIFECSSGNNFGQFIILASIVPSVGYTQGINRHILDINRFDFYSPEFDALGTQAISKSELYVPTQGSSLDYFSGIFGFTPRYSHYKVQLDQLTGDFVLPTQNVGMDSWHLFRQFADSATEYLRPEEIVHNSEFVTGVDENYKNDDPSFYYSQYDRIFSNVRPSADHFFLFFDINAELYAPFKPLFDTYDFDEERGKEIVANLNGQQLS